ncbi:MAG: type II toxin-antitoxin system PemK/MazF family toxin [Parafilimonas sp.]
MRYQKGDIVWVNFPFTDGSQMKPRPVLIISNETVNKTGDYILVQITSKFKKDNLSIEISDSA